MMIRKFLQDRRGNYALATIAVTVPLLGALALAVDYSEMSREREMTLNALDAAGIATARRLIEGASAAELQTYARDFLNANLGNIDPGRVQLSLVLPDENTAGGGTLKIGATLDYDPLFFGAFERLRGQSPQDLSFSASSEVKLKNTIEVALVLDNSGSMDYIGTGSGKKRMVLLKEAAKQLVDALSAQGLQMKQLQKPVQFGLVPFAASVNVGPENEHESWMDRTGVSPIHHENFDWTVLNSTSFSVENIGGVQWARGSGWDAINMRNRQLTRFTLYENLRYLKGTTTTSGTTYSYERAIAWEGCVEARPSPYNVNDEAASTGNPATMFVPMFAPDEVGNIWTKSQGSVKTFGQYNSWWDDDTRSTDTSTTALRSRQRSMAKYLSAAPYGTTLPKAHEGPNSGCTTKPILPLTDVSTTTGVDTVKAAIDAMASNGATNVPEGMAWGWRVLSSKAPFTGGRAETEKGNDKVVIVLTDGANTYYTPNSLGSYDNADLKSIYSNAGYAGVNYNNSTTPRIFMNTTVSKTTFTNANFTSAMNEHFATLCDNAKKNNLIVMTVALDLNSTNATEKAQIDALSACASNSKIRRDSSGNAAKLFWNATGSSLADDFKSIADELSNLRIVS